MNNTLFDVNPKVSAEWHPTLNGELMPNYISPHSGKMIWWRCHKDHDHVWQAVVYSRMNGTGCPYCSGRYATPGKTDLATLNPGLASEWHPTLNGKLMPKNIKPYSNKMIWWICHKDHDHVWQAAVHNRMNGIDCPYCSGRYVIPGKTDLATLNPGLASEWHPTLNGELMPKDIRPYSTKMIWWICHKDHDHVWQAVVYSRMNGTGCPYCYSRYTIPGKTDLATLNPDLASEWHPTLNGELMPKDIRPYSNKMIWWRCRKDHDHVWQAAVYHRTNGTGCPYCSGRYATPGKTDLATLNPGLASEWHPTLNGELMPKDIRPYSNKMIWWSCHKDHDHVWQAAVYHRTNGTGCPYCSGRYVIPGKTDLATLNPDLASEWHPTLNGELIPKDISPHSHKMIWWSCHKNHDHVWQATVYNRTKGKGCPYCSRRYAIPCKTDLVTLNPNLASEWHPTLNGELMPNDISPYSNKMKWWRCNKDHDHVWHATVNSRMNGTGCPYCRGSRYTIRKKLSSN